MKFSARNMLQTIAQVFLILLSITQALPGMSQAKNSYAIISPKELSELLTRDKDLLILDVRSTGDYRNEHIPGALNIQKKMLDNNELDYPGMIAPKKQVEEVLSGLGVHPQSHLVIYDDSGDLEAARVWFVLKNYGHNSIRLLDGGFSNWKKDNLAVTDKSEKPGTSDYKFPDDPGNEYYATRDDVKNLEGKPNVVILDVRSDREYSDGHIPGALNLNWVNNLDSDKIFKTREELLAQFAKAGINPDNEVVTYCRSGTRASHTAFVLRELLGFKNVKIYDGSWLEWSHFGEKVEK